MPEMAGGRSRVNRIPDFIKRLHLIFVSYTTVKLEVGWGKTESKSSFSDPDTKLWPKRQIQPNTFVNKILLQCTYLFMYFAWLLSSYNGRIEQMKQNVYCAKPKIFIIWYLTVKIFVNSCPNLVIVAVFIHPLLLTPPPLLLATSHWMLHTKQWTKYLPHAWFCYIVTES